MDDSTNDERRTRRPSTDEQIEFWEEWNRTYREEVPLSMEATRRGEVALELLKSFELSEPSILEIGCANGWLSAILAQHGRVVALDIAESIVARARQRVPQVEFIAGDFARVSLDDESFDLVISLETLAHVSDQQAFVDRVASVLRPGGYLIITTQNRFVWSRTSQAAPTAHGQIQNWLNMSEFKRLVRSRFSVLRAFTIIPAGDLGLARLVNSHKLGRVTELFASPEGPRKLRERLGFGNTLVIAARRAN